MTTRHNLRALFRRHAQLLVTCPACPLLQPLTVSDFMKKHVYEVHHLTRRACAFCLGDFVWRRCQFSALETVRHQRSCFKTFRINNKYVAPEPVNPPPEPDDLPTADVCEPCKNFDPSLLKLNMCGREMVPSWERHGFYDPIFRKPEWWEDGHGILFHPDSGIGPDMTVILDRFAQFKWYHVSVKPFTFPYFKRELACIQEHLAVLPYECHCDGLETSKEHDERNHRHMILAVKSSFDEKFQKIWKEKVRNPHYTGLLGKVSKQIKNKHHLVCCIQYLGQPHSRCDGQSLTEACGGRASHYRITQPVYPDGELGMCHLYSGGLQDYILARTQRKNVLPWLSVAERGEGRQYMVPLASLNLKIQNCVIPVRRDLKPFAILDKDHEQYPFKLWLYELNTCLVFVVDAEWANLSKDEWYVAQKMGKNYMFGSILQSLYILTYAQQRTMRQLKQLHQSLKEEMQEQSRIFTHENHKMHLQMREMHLNMEKMIQEALQEAQETWKREREAWKDEKAVWRAREERLQRTIDTLHHEIYTMNKKLKALQPNPSTSA